MAVIVSAPGAGMAHAARLPLAPVRIRHAATEALAPTQAIPTRANVYQDMRAPTAATKWTNVPLRLVKMEAPVSTK